MNFNSYDYAVFFAVVLGSFWLVPRRVKLPILLVASYVFYASLDWRFLGLLVLSTAVDFTVARAIARSPRRRDQQRWLLVSLLTHLAVLGYFKYAEFFYEGIVDALSGLGIAPSELTLQIALPVGVSFYTFQSMSYTIDVYRRKIEPTDDVVAYATYVAFFPQLLAGPIERAGALLPQLQDLRTRLAAFEVREGVDLILLGLFKKVAVADVMGRLVIDVYGQEDRFRDGILVEAGQPGWVSLVVATIALSIQIYCDFSGYSDIARGSAKLLGIDLSRNFLRPFWSDSYRELWRRWHITLMNWFRDYVYIPLGGNRVSPARGYANILIVFGLSGLWHGATSGFLLWGLLNGVVICLETAWSRHRPVPAPEIAEPVAAGGGGVPTATSGGAGGPTPAVTTRPRSVPERRALRVLGVNVVWAITVVPLGAGTIGATLDVWGGILRLQSGPVVAAEIALVLYALGALVATDVRQRWLDRIEDRRRAGGRPVVEPAWRWSLVSGLMIIGIVAFSGGGVEPFFYFQF